MDGPEWLNECPLDAKSSDNHSPEKCFLIDLRLVD